MIINNLLPKTAGTVTEENEVGAEEEDIEENDQNKNHDALWMHLQRLTRQVEVAENYFADKNEVGAQEEDIEENEQNENHNALITVDAPAEVDPAGAGC